MNLMPKVWTSIIWAAVVFSAYTQARLTSFLFISRLLPHITGMLLYAVSNYDEIVPDVPDVPILPITSPYGKLNETSGTSGTSGTNLISYGHCTVFLRKSTYKVGYTQFYRFTDLLIY